MQMENGDGLHLGNVNKEWVWKCLEFHPRGRVHLGTQLLCTKLNIHLLRLLPFQWQVSGFFAHFVCSIFYSTIPFLLTLRSVKCLSFLEAVVKHLKNV